MTHSEPNEHGLRSTRHLLHPQECLERWYTHLSYLNVRFIHGLCICLNDLLHLENVVLFDVLEFLQDKASAVMARLQII